MLILLSGTSCGVKQSKDKQEAKKNITREGDYSYANSTDIEFVKSKFPNIEDIKSVSYIYAVSYKHLDVYKRQVWMREIKWVFLDVGSTLVDESDVYESRCSYVISAKGCLLYTSRCV